MEPEVDLAKAKELLKVHLDAKAAAEKAKTVFLAAKEALEAANDRVTAAEAALVEHVHPGKTRNPRWAILTHDGKDYSVTRAGSDHYDTKAIQPITRHAL